jgi:hypothetical protein
MPMRVRQAYLVPKILAAPLLFHWPKDPISIATSTGRLPRKNKFKAWVAFDLPRISVDETLSLSIPFIFRIIFPMSVNEACVSFAI